MIDFLSCKSDIQFVILLKIGTFLVFIVLLGISVAMVTFCAMSYVSRYSNLYNLAWLLLPSFGPKLIFFVFDFDMHLHANFILHFLNCSNCSIMNDNKTKKGG